MPLSDRERALGSLRDSLEFLGGEAAPQFEQFASLFTIKKLKQGESFAREAEQATAVAFVLEGVARMFYRRADGKEFNKGFVFSSEFMSALESLLTGEPSRLTIQALTPMSLLVANYAAVTAFFERDMFWQRVGRRSIEQVYVKKVRREASLLTSSAAERYCEFIEEKRAGCDQIPDYHIAAYLGISAESLSRLKRKAKDAVASATAE